MQFKFACKLPTVRLYNCKPKKTNSYDVIYDKLYDHVIL